MADFSDEIVKKVWEKAKIVEGTNINSNEWRKDYAGAWINFKQRGCDGGEYAWCIDHVNPIDNGGSDNLDNLLPLHWQNNATKANNYPKWKTSVSSSGNKNIEKEQSWEIKK